MANLLRPCSPALALLLANGNLPKLFSADLFEFTLLGGATTYYWTNWGKNIDLGAQTYISKAPWLSRSKWGLTNKMSVPNLTVKLSAFNTSFGGGANIKTQIHNGLFDGASFRMRRAFMVNAGDTSTFGAIDIFGGLVSSIQMDGSTVEITIKGKNNTLDQSVPRNMYQAGCNHAFCDPGCTLNRASFTTAYLVGTTPTSMFIPWAGAPPGNFALYLNGTVTLTGGAGAGQSRTVAVADATGLTLSYPLYIVPAAADGFDAFQGCDKTFNSGSGQSCTDYANTQHYRGFEFIPPPTTAV